MLLLLFTLIVGYASSAPTTKTEDLFEGDLKISESMIRKYYNVTEYEQRTGEKFHFRVRDERAAASDSSILWSNGIVYYTYDSSIPTSVGNTIRSAMDDYIWEENLPAICPENLRNCFLHQLYSDRLGVLQ